MTLPPSRPMGAGDVAAVLHIESDLYPYPWSPGNFVDSIAAGYDARVFESQDGRICAYWVVMTVLDEAHLLNLSVRRDRQRAGLGAAMLRWLGQQLQRQGVRTLLLEVRPSNVPAIRLYGRVGFMTIGRRPDYYPAAEGTREDAIVMRSAVPLRAGSPLGPEVSERAGGADLRDASARDAGAGDAGLNDRSARNLGVHGTHDPSAPDLGSSRAGPRNPGVERAS